MSVQDLTHEQAADLVNATNDPQALVKLLDDLLVEAARREDAEQAARRKQERQETVQRWQSAYAKFTEIAGILAPYVNIPVEWPAEKPNSCSSFQIKAPNLAPVQLTIYYQFNNNPDWSTDARPYSVPSATIKNYNDPDKDAEPIYSWDSNNAIRCRDMLNALLNARRQFHKFSDEAQRAQARNVEKAQERAVEEARQAQERAEQEARLAELDQAIDEEAEPAPGTCRVCGCTDMQACPGGCSWVDETHTLCSQCAPKAQQPAPTPSAAEQLINLVRQIAREEAEAVKYED